jgi:hypothetical protein
MSSSASTSTAAASTTAAASSSSLDSLREPLTSYTSVAFKPHELHEYSRLFPFPQSRLATPALKYAPKAAWYAILSRYPSLYIYGRIMFAVSHYPLPNIIFWLLSASFYIIISLLYPHIPHVAFLIFDSKLDVNMLFNGCACLVVMVSLYSQFHHSAFFALLGTCTEIAPVKTRRIINVSVFIALCLGSVFFSLNVYTLDQMDSGGAPDWVFILGMIPATMFSYGLALGLAMWIINARLLSLVICDTTAMCSRGIQLPDDLLQEQMSYASQEHEDWKTLFEAMEHDTNTTSSSSSAINDDHVSVDVGVGVGDSDSDIDNPKHHSHSHSHARVSISHLAYSYDQLALGASSGSNSNSNSRHHQMSHADIDELRVAHHNVEAAIQQHDVVARLLDSIPRPLTPIILWKVFADVTLLMMGIAKMFSQHSDATILLPLIILMISVVVAVFILLPAAMLTNQFRSMADNVIKMRPFAKTIHQRHQIQTIVDYLMPFSQTGGLRVLGMCITPELTARAMALMYTLFAASNIA